MIKFGTSGFRGILGDNFTKENIIKIADALMEMARRKGIFEPSAVVGFDNRFMSKEFANYMAEELSKEFNVTVFERSVHTPIVSFLAKENTFGIMITASHNPYVYNGVKIFFDGGRDSDDEFNRELENIILELDGKVNEREINRENISIKFSISEYVNMISDMVDIQNKKKKILFECMHGSSVWAIKEISSRVGLKNYSIINENVDPYFNNIPPAPYLKNLVNSRDVLLKENFDICLAFDGDGDRFSLIDRNGEMYDCNTVLGMLFYHMVTNKNLKGNLVKNNAMSNINIKVAEFLGRECEEVSVGFKCISPLIKNGFALLGGESNGICYKNGALTKDGVMVAFLILEMLDKEEKSYTEMLEELKRKIGFESFVLEETYNLKDGDRERITKLLYEDKLTYDIGLKIEKITYQDGVKVFYEGGYWTCVRFSGNENVVRLFIEVENEKKAQEVLRTMEDFLCVYEKQI